MEPLRVLVTNDDGVEAPGLHALAAAVAELGHDVVVVAPDVDMSGAGASLGRMAGTLGDLEARPVLLPGAEDVTAWSLAGPPGLCVLAARLGALGDPPDLVVSGINPGCNTGRAVLHSGTVGAALTAANFGVSGLAVSIDVPSAEPRGPADGGARAAHAWEFGGRAPAQQRGLRQRSSATRDKADLSADVLKAGEGPSWATAAAFGAAAVRWLAESPPGTVLNVNVPNLPRDEVQGVRWAELAPFGTVRTTVVQPVGPEGGRLQLELRPGGNGDLPAGSDTALVKSGYVTVTRLTGVQATEPLDPAEVFGVPPHPRQEAPGA